MDDRDLLIRALVGVWAALPGLVGDDWPLFEATVLIRLRALEAASPKDVENACDAVLAEFDAHPAARERLVEAYADVAPTLERGSADRPRVAGSTGYARYLEIPIFFATDRALAADASAPPFYSGERNPKLLTYGVARVAVPDDHRSGMLEKPRWWKLQFRQDPEQFVVVLGVDALDRVAFVKTARQLIATAVLPEALVFIHGYNVSFDDAARRAAQIAYDLHFEGLTLLYSWASEGAFVRYGIDKGNATWSVPRFRSFLTLVLSELGASHVHAIAHSMGNEVCANGLATFDTSTLAPGSATLRQIVFAAPDVDAATFSDLAEQFHGRADHFTLYASSKDKALQASQGYQKYPRAGQAGDGLVIVDGVDTIDASDLDTGFMSHSYIGDHASILSDVDDLIRRGTPADKRKRLSASKHARGTYWKVMPGVVAP